MQEGTFDIDDVAEGVVSKLIRRHPHVFGDADVDSAAEVLVNWERIKSEEKGEHGIDEEIPPTLPALSRAAKVQRRAAGSGVDWRTAAAALAEDLSAELVLLRVEHEPTEVWRDEYGRPIAYLDEQKARAQQLAGDYLDQVVDSARKQWPGVPIHTNVQFGVPAVRIAEVATTTGAALVFMATHGRTGLRRAVMGTEDRLPGPPELARMRSLVWKAMADGAVGFSTGLQYVPGTYAKAPEIIELARVAANAGGVYASHMRNEGTELEDAVAETIRVGDLTGARVQISHLKVDSPSRWGISAKAGVLRSPRGVA